MSETTVAIVIFAAIILVGLFVILRKKTTVAQPPVAGSVQNDGSIRDANGAIHMAGPVWIPSAELGIAESYGWTKSGDFTPDPSIVLVTR